MSSSSLELLTIDQSVKLHLRTILEEFDSYRVGNDLSKKVKKVFSDSTVEEVKTKKRKPSLLKRLFLTEYA